MRRAPRIASSNARASSSLRGGGDFGIARRLELAEGVDHLMNDLAVRIVARAIEVAVAAVRPGVSTAELDALAEREITAAGATPSRSASKLARVLHRDPS